MGLFLRVFTCALGAGAVAALPVNGLVREFQAFPLCAASSGGIGVTGERVRVPLGPRALTVPTRPFSTRSSFLLSAFAADAPPSVGVAVNTAPICSSIGAAGAELIFPFCRVASTIPATDKPPHHVVTLSLTTTTGSTEVGGYHVSALDNYNGGYLPPIVELDPGDTLKVRLVNALSSKAMANSMHHTGGNDGVSSTNLHTHGLIVSPKNATSAQPQNGDNIFIKLNRGQTIDYSIEIPTELPASLFDVKNVPGYNDTIPHPSGLYWYHSHLHMRSASQVGGGMSGLVSIGPRDANVVDVNPAETPALKKSTDVSYLMLRDIQISSMTDPLKASGDAQATWINPSNSRLCEPTNIDPNPMPPIAKREGYCQNPTYRNLIWLFTVNGQRFPTYRIPNGRNALFRIGNLSAAATYDIKFLDSSATPVPFYVVSVDGVVPGSPTKQSDGKVPVLAAIQVAHLVLMPAARAEIFIENDNNKYNTAEADQTLVLSTAGVNTGTKGEPDAGDPWPEMKLASVILERGVSISTTQLGLNVSAVKTGAQLTGPLGHALESQTLQPPAGCVRDINKAALEHRKVEFDGSPGAWSMSTDLVHPKDTTKLQKFDTGFENVKDDSPSHPTSLDYVAFDDYLTPDGVDWEAARPGNPPHHTCVNLKNGHGQLWELENPTSEWHNFHIHQSKFRLADDQELRAYGIDPESVHKAQGLGDGPLPMLSDGGRNVWHDTLPVLPGIPTFIVINFDAREQLGRYVYHCHILTHEDAGLMAPIEVYE